MFYHKHRNLINDLVNTFRKVYEPLEKQVDHIIAAPFNSPRIQKSAGRVQANEEKRFEKEKKAGKQAKIRGFELAF